MENKRKYVDEMRARKAHVEKLMEHEKGVNGGLVMRKWNIGCASVYIIFALLITLWAFTWEDASGHDTDFFGWSSVIILFIFLPLGFWAGASNDREYAKKVSNANSRYKRNLENHLDFKESTRFMSVDFDTSLSVDESSNTICIMDSRLSVSKTYLCKDIIEVQVIEDSVTVSKTSRGSQIGGAVIGGVLAGGVGAVIGGLSGNTVQSNRVKRIELKVIVNDTAKPVILINFMNEYDEKSGLKNKMGETKESKKYKSAIEQAIHWHGLISVLIKRADNEDKRINNNLIGDSSDGHFEEITNISISDELTKLYELHTKGIISKEEFENQKAKILAK
jgi:hypothetical protein